MHSHLGAGVTTDRRQLTSIYLFYFSFFFCILFACLRFGSHFWSHDSHVTGEHMVEQGGHFCCFLQEQTVLQRTRTRTLNLK